MFQDFYQKKENGLIISLILALRILLDYLEKRRDVDSKKVGVMAISLGGYYAPRNASMEKRFKACVAWGGIWNYHETWKKRIEAEYKTALSVPGHHLTWIMNTKTIDRFRIEALFWACGACSSSSTGAS